MPLYEYRCDACGRRFELIQRFSDPPAETCAVCGSGPVHKLLSSPAFQFKGSGWYVTDYARKDQKSEKKAEQGEGAAAKDSSKESVKNKAETGEKSSAVEKSGGSQQGDAAGKRASTPAAAPTKE